MRELSLFTGAGGGLLGSMLLGFRTVAAVEWDPYCQKVLCARGGYMADAGSSGLMERAPESDTRGMDGAAGHMRGAGSEQAVSPWCGREGFPIYGDIRTFHPEPDSCDIVTGGFPCQPFSHAGKRLGEDDSRNMWPHAVRVLVESGAPLGFFENVPGLLSSGYFGTVLGDLAEAGFDAEWCVLGADDVGAPHRRKRLWILAYAECKRLEGRTLGQVRGVQPTEGSSPWWCDPANADPNGKQMERPTEPWSECGGGQPEPRLGGAIDGLATLMDRISPSRCDRLGGMANAKP